MKCIRTRQRVLQCRSFCATPGAAKSDTSSTSSVRPAVALFAQHRQRLDAAYDKVFSSAADEYRGDLALPPHLQSLCRLAFKERQEREEIIPQGVLGIGQNATSSARRVIYVIASYTDSYLWLASTRQTAGQDFMEMCLRAHLFPKRDPFKWILRHGVDDLLALPLESLNCNVGKIHVEENHDELGDEKHVRGQHNLTFGPLSKIREAHWRKLLASAAMPDLEYSY